MKRLYPRLLRSALAGGILQGALIVGAAAQTPRWSTPSLGFVFDADSKSIRPLSGVIGAASLEGGIAIASKLENASISPNRQIALAQTLDGDHLLLVRWDVKAGSATPLDGSPASADLIVWSPDGGSAAIYNADAQQVQLWRSLTSEPALAAQYSASAVAALAVADDGVVVAAMDSGLFQLAAEPKQISDAAYSALAFAPGTHDLAAANAVVNQVVFFPNLSSDNQVTVASAADGLGQPNGISFSRDGGKLAVTSSSSKAVLLIDNATSAKQNLSCGCSPDGVFAAQGNAVFRITNAGQDGIILLDGDSTEARLLTIPVGGRQ
jgi:WD40 repeat protein